MILANIATMLITYIAAVGISVTAVLAIVGIAWLHDTLSGDAR